FLRAAHFLPLAAFIVANQLPHPQLNLTELHPLALVLLPDGAGVFAVGRCSTSQVGWSGRSG
ncbi:hypothetical protein KKJ06_03400, partial [Xenorhabdus bovienii]